MQFLSQIRFPVTQILFCFLSLLASTGRLRAVDSSEQFLSAYQACQEGEKLEREGAAQNALKKYWIAESLLEEIIKNDSSWQKAVVEHRQKQVRDGLRRLQPGVTFPDAIKTPPSEHPIGVPVLQILSSSLSNNGERTKKLLVSIKSKTNEAFDSTEEKVQVYFYDHDGKEIVPSKAQINSRWLNWQGGEPQLIEVTYLPESLNQNIKFAGYVISVYFKGNLQDSWSDPPRLKKVFPPKHSIGCEE
jgi:hypothetical protein